MPEYEELKRDLSRVHASVRTAREQLKEKGRAVVNALSDQVVHMGFIVWDLLC